MDLSNVKWRELLNPWAALRSAKLEIAVLTRERALLLEELVRVRDRKNDHRGSDGRFKKGGRH